MLKSCIWFLMSQSSLLMCVSVRREGACFIKTGWADRGQYGWTDIQRFTRLYESSPGCWFPPPVMLSSQCCALYFKMFFSYWPYWQESQKNSRLSGQIWLGALEILPLNPETLWLYCMFLMKRSALLYGLCECGDFDARVTLENLTSINFNRR